MLGADESIDLNSTVDSSPETGDLQNGDVVDENYAITHGEKRDITSTEISTSTEGIKMNGDHIKSKLTTEERQLAGKEKLKAGILNAHVPDLTLVHDRVREVIRNQGVILDSTQNELTQLKECTMLSEIWDTFENVKVYHKKLTGIKKDMSQLLEHSQRLRLRAHKLQIQKQKDELALASEKERQLKYEKELTAKPAAEYVANL